MITKKGFDTEYEKLKKKFDVKTLAEAEKPWKPIIKLIESYEKKKDPNVLVEISDIIYTERTTTLKGKLAHHDLMFWLIDNMDEELAPSLVENGGALKNGETDIFSADVRSQLFELAKFACDDVERWSGEINESHGPYYKESLQRNRAWWRKTDKKFYEPLNSAKGSSNCESIDVKVYKMHEYTGTFKGILENTKKAKSGICTTYGFAAASILIADKIKNAKTTKLKRIEVIGWKKGHVYVIVNREGEIDKPATWGKDVFQVDAWLGSLGRKYLIKGIKGDNSGFLTNVEVLFDSKLFDK